MDEVLETAWYPATQHPIREILNSVYDFVIALTRSLIMLRVKYLSERKSGSSALTASVTKEPNNINIKGRRGMRWWTNSIHVTSSLPTYYPKIHINIILPCPLSSTWPLFKCFNCQNSAWVICFTLPTHTLAAVHECHITAGFEVFVAMNTIMLFMWVLAPCKLVGRCQRFGETCCLHLHVYTAPKPR